MQTAERFSSDVVLSDGSLIRVAPVAPGDREALARFLEGLSSEALELRFNGPVGDRTRLLTWLLPSPNSFALAAWHEGTIVAHAAYHRMSPEVAEPGIIVAEPYWGRGLGTILLGQLSEAANADGISTLEHLVSASNPRVLTVIRDLGFPITQHFEPGLIRVTQPTSLSADVVERFSLREAASNAAAVRGFLRPRSVAVIGASTQRGTIGGELFHNCISGGFPGPVYPVNPNHPVVQSVVSYASISDCPGPVDLAIICVPAPAVLDVAEACASKGVRSLLVISAGFGESGEQGRALQRQLVETCRRHGMRLVGPNCMGIANTAPTVSLNAQFAALQPSPGSIGILSQSGAVGIALLDYANHLGHGMSSFVSVGNKADISGNDLLSYWETDDETNLILLYLESFGNPRKFAQIARRVSRKKPIVAVKGGRSAAGFRATQSHTGALVAASNVTVDALFRQSGVIRTDTLEEMFDVAAFLDSQPVPKGPNIGIITNAGGAGILATDACENAGLSVPELSAKTQEALRSFLRPDASVRNPVDMVASATRENYRTAIQILARDPGIDALVVIFIPPLELKASEVAQDILFAAGKIGGRVPIAAVLMASPDVPPLLSDGKVRLPSYQFPEAAVSAIAKAVEHGRWLATPDERPPTFPDVQRTRAATLVGTAVASGGGWLPPEKVQELLGYCGISTVAARYAATPEAAGAAADELGGQVVLKGIAPGVLHKRDAGAVVVGLEGRAAVESAARDMAARLASQGHPIERFLLQPQISEAVEMLVGVTHDSTFGPVVACGAGGTLVELVKDVVVRLAPLTEREADEMLASLRTYPLLTGYRGSPPADVTALRTLLLRVGRMADYLHGIVEMDLNPVMVLPDGKGVAVVDARVRVAETPPDIPLGAKKR